jgi:hypothetical protein
VDRRQQRVGMASDLPDKINDAHAEREEVSGYVGVGFADEWRLEEARRLPRYRDPLPLGMRLDFGPIWRICNAEFLAPSKIHVRIKVELSERRVLGLRGIDRPDEFRFILGKVRTDELRLPPDNLGAYRDWFRLDTRLIEVPQGAGRTVLLLVEQKRTQPFESLLLSPIEFCSEISPVDLD